MRRSAGPFLVAAVAAALTWRIDLAPAAVPNIDASWGAGLYMAAKKGIHFGPDLAFVFGPLGFLFKPALYYSAPALLATLATGAAYLASLVLFARLLWRRLGPGWATVLTLLAASATALLKGPERVEAIFLLLALGIVLDDRSELRRGAVAGLAALTALMLLVKISSGAVMLAMLVVIASLPLLRRRPWREAALVVGTAAGVLVLAFGVLWLVSGQSLPDIPDYLRNAREVISGNADAVSIEAPGRGGDYVLAAISVAALAVAAALALRPLRRANQVAGTGLLGIYVWVTLRHGFTRHDSHVVLFFAPLLLGLPALVPERRASEPWTRPPRAQAAALAVAAIALGIGSMSYRAPSNLFRFSTEPLVNAVTTLSSSNNRVHVIQGTRMRLQAAYGLPPAMLARVSGQTVHIDPWEAAVAWAYPSIHWRPVPLFQSFTAYTTGLDDLNADFLASRRAPRYVLHQSLAQDMHLARFESPRYVEQLVCRYRQVSVGAGWQLLERAHDRCGGAVQIERRRVRLGQMVPLPDVGRHDMLVASFGDLSESAWQSLRGLVFKRSHLYVGTGGGRVNRFVRGHAQSPHVLEPPACLGWDPGLFDSTTRYRAVGIGHDRASLARRGKPEGSGHYDLRLYRVSFRCPGTLPAP